MILAHPDTLRSQGLIIPGALQPLVAQLSQRDFARQLTVELWYPWADDTGKLLTQDERTPHLVTRPTGRLWIKGDRYFEPAAVSDAVIISEADDGVMTLRYETFLGEVTATRLCDHSDILSCVELYLLKLLQVAKDDYRSYCIDGGRIKATNGDFLHRIGDAFHWEY
ncbi:MAG: hypothetical protein SFV23_16410 [Planctomycetaceae bacterium]|nr:hypothetical protein [Planctomycetaceae bacterium]